LSPAGCTQKRKTVNKENLDHFKILELLLELRPSKSVKLVTIFRETCPQNAPEPHYNLKRYYKVLEIRIFGLGRIIRVMTAIE
jgi:hypothetical protein